MNLKFVSNGELWSRWNSRQEGLFEFDLPHQIFNCSAPEGAVVSTSESGSLPSQPSQGCKLTAVSNLSSNVKELPTFTDTKLDDEELTGKSHLVFHLLLRFSPDSDVRNI